MNKFAHFFRRPWHDKLNSVHAALVALKTVLYYRRIFKNVGSGCHIYKPLLISNPRFVSIGSNTSIRQGARIELIVLDKLRPPSIVIGNNVNIEQNVHIICSSKIVIGNNVSITGHCCIVDTVHPFRDVDDPRKIGERISPEPTPVEIGDNTFIGFGTVILPNVRIGKNCIVGANSTVTRDVQDFCVIGGSPASILMRYDSETKMWI